MREYKCHYRHCLHPGEPIPQGKAVLIGAYRYHEDCAVMHGTIERIKRILFNNVNSNLDYVQTTGVINNLIFRRKYQAEYVEFMAKYLALHHAKINTPYSLHYAVKNKIIINLYSSPKDRKKVIEEYADRFG